MSFTSAEVGEFLGSPRLTSDYPIKPVSSRKRRPSWAKNDRSLMKHLMTAKFLQRLRIAYLYWRENRTAKQVAVELGMTLAAVKNAIKRMRA